MISSQVDILASGKIITEQYPLEFSTAAFATFYFSLIAASYFDTQESVKWFRDLRPCILHRALLVNHRFIAL